MGLVGELRRGFVMTAMYNFLIIVFSKGFGPDLGNVDVLFEPDRYARTRILRPRV